MSEKEFEIKKENLIQQYHELVESWDGKNLKIEQQMQNIAGELADYGINVDDFID